MSFKEMLILGVMLVVAFGVQYIFGFKQIKHLGDEYGKMRREGRVAIGRKPGRIKAGTIVFLSLDDKGIIRYGRKLQGITILARFKDFNTLNGLKLNEISKDSRELQRELKITREAVMDAINNYNLVLSGQQIPEKLSPFGKLSSKLAK